MQAQRFCSQVYPFPLSQRFGWFDWSTHSSPYLDSASTDEMANRQKRAKKSSRRIEPCFGVMLIEILKETRTNLDFDRPLPTFCMRFELLSQASAGKMPNLHRQACFCCPCLSAYKFS